MNVNEVVRAATSQEPLVDTYGMACQLRRDVFDNFDHVDTKHFLTEHSDLWWKLLANAEEYDISAYQKLIEPLLEKARK